VNLPTFFWNRVTKHAVARNLKFQHSTKNMMKYVEQKNLFYTFHFFLAFLCCRPKRTEKVIQRVSWIWGRFSVLTQLPQKMPLDSKVIKIDSKIIISVSVQKLACKMSVKSNYDKHFIANFATNSIQFFIIQKNLWKTRRISLLCFEAERIITFRFSL